jgi:hypothetical protein
MSIRGARLHGTNEQAPVRRRARRRFVAHVAHVAWSFACSMKLRLVPATPSKHACICAADADDRALVGRTERIATD